MVSDILANYAKMYIVSKLMTRRFDKKILLLLMLFFDENSSNYHRQKTK